MRRYNDKEKRKAKTHGLLIHSCADYVILMLHRRLRSVGPFEFFVILALFGKSRVNYL